MKIVTTFNALVINTKSTEYTRKSDGKESMMYQISFDQNGECGTVSCTEEVVKSVARLTDCELTAEYNDQYKTFRIISAKLLPKKPGAQH